MSDRIISHYQIVEQIGHGGMGEVFKARDTRLGRFVALKAMPAEKVADPERRRRFLQEAQAASALNHPNIITIHDIVNEGGGLYLVMELVAGNTLADLLAPSGVPVADALRYGIQIADALSAAHRAGIIHRDLKPGNVMVTPGRLVKLLDFGLAKLSPEFADSDETALEMTLTREGTIVGTVSYMSPEQAEGRPLDGRSDIFSFGALLYEMLTGQKAFRGTSSLSTLSMVLRDDPQPARELVSGLPAGLDEVIRKALRKDPAHRYQSMDEVKIALARIADEIQGLSHLNATITTSAMPKAPAAPAPASAPVETAKPARSPLPMVAAAVLLLVLAGGAAWYFSRSAQPVPAPPGLRQPAETAVETPPPATPPPTPGAAASARPAPSAGISAAPAPASSSSARELTVPDGTRLHLRLSEDIPEATEEGRPVRFDLLSDVAVNGVPVIRKGARVNGVITDAGKKGLLRRAKAYLQMETVEMAGAGPLKLRNAQISDASRPIDVTAAVSAQKRDKPKDILAPKGTEYFAYTDGDAKVRVP